MLASSQMCNGRINFYKSHSNLNERRVNIMRRQQNLFKCHVNLNERRVNITRRKQNIMLRTSNIMLRTLNLMRRNQNLIPRRTNIMKREQNLMWRKVLLTRRTTNIMGVLASQNQRNRYFMLARIPLTQYWMNFRFFNRDFVTISSVFKTTSY
jgi:hypothetical protein